MKLNLPSTLTSQKAWSLFFLTLLHLKQTKAGNAFKNCLNHSNYGYIDTTSYNGLLNYPFTSNSIINSGMLLGVCCNKIECYSTMSKALCPTDSPYFACTSLSQKIICEGGAYLCAGIVGNTPITSEVVSGTCPDLTTISNYISTVSSTSAIDTNGLSEGYAWWNCAIDSPCPGLFCGWDNGGWTCSSSVNSNVSCFLQWSAPWPGPAAYNPMPTITSNSPASTNSPNNNHQSNSSNHSTYLSDAEKIAASVGGVTGAGIISFLTYYFCKKRKNQQKLIIANKMTAEENNHLESQAIELTKKELVSPRLNSNLIQSGQKIEVEESQSAKQQSVVDLSNQRFSADINYQLQLIAFTPPHSPTPSQTINVKQLMLNELRNKLIGKEQLWTDYLDVNNILITSPYSQFAINQKNNLQQQLLQFLTIAEIGLLLEDNHSYASNSQTEYSELIEQSPVQSFNSNSPQPINTRNPQWRG